MNRKCDGLYVSEDDYFSFLEYLFEFDLEFLLYLPGELFLDQHTLGLPLLELTPLSHGFSEDCGQVLPASLKVTRNSFSQELAEPQEELSVTLALVIGKKFGARLLRREWHHLFKDASLEVIEVVAILDLGLASLLEITDVQ